MPAQVANQEGPEWVKWELGLACFGPGKMGFRSLEFRSLGLGFGHWEWGKKCQKWKWDKYFVTMTSRDITYFLGLRKVKKGFKHVMFGTSVEEAVKTVSNWAAAYYTHPMSYYKLPTSHAVSLPRIKIPKPTSQEITRNKQAEMRAWAKMHGKSVRQRNVDKIAQWTGRALCL